MGIHSLCSEDNINKLRLEAGENFNLIETGLISLTQALLSIPDKTAIPVVHELQAIEDHLILDGWYEFSYAQTSVGVKLHRDFSNDINILVRHNEDADIVVDRYVFSSNNGITVVQRNLVKREENGRLFNYAGNLLFRCHDNKSLTPKTRVKTFGCLPVLRLQ